MAETILRASLAEAGLDGLVTLDSAGTGDWHIGEPMSAQARAALASRGYDGSAHRARQFRPSWLTERDLVLAMDARNLATLRRMAGAADRDRIRLFGEVGGLGQGGGGEIPDPYGGSEADFRHVLELLRSAAPVIGVRLARLLEPGPGGQDRGGPDRAAPAPAGPDRAAPAPAGPDRAAPAPAGPDPGPPGALT
jgi:protein-tyrosine phosphatase